MNEAIQTYGISVLSRGKIIMQVEDVSLEKRAVVRLVQECNRLHVEPVHLWDILEDFWGAVLYF